MPPAVSAGGPAFVNQGIALNRAGSFADPGADTWTATVDYGDGSGVQPLALNPDKSFALAHTYAAVGGYTATVTVRDDDGGVGTASVSVTVLPPVGVDAVVANGGAAQRSRVTTLAVTFSQEVEAVRLQQPGAFQLLRASDGAAVGAVAVSSAVVGGKTVATLTFGGANTESGSLADGRWSLAVATTAVRSVATGGSDGRPTTRSRWSSGCSGTGTGTGTWTNGDLVLFRRTNNRLGRRPAVQPGLRLGPERPGGRRRLQPSSSSGTAPVWPSG